MKIEIINKINNKNLKQGNTKKLIILHHTGSSASDEANIKYLNKNDKVSAHYLVGIDGKIYQLVDDDMIAYHAGNSKYSGFNSKNNSLNHCSIGIEVNSDGINFSKEQKISTNNLILYLMNKYKIPAKNVLRHKDISTTGKIDIGDNFWNVGFKSWSDYQNYLDTKVKELNNDTNVNINNNNNIDKINLNIEQQKAIKAIMAVNSAMWYILPNNIKIILEETNNKLKDFI